MNARTSTRWAAVFAAAIAAGCAVGPDYERPKIASPPAFRFEDAATSASLADVPWWKVFGDPWLHALITEALQRNFDLLVASARVEESRALAHAAGAQLLPRLSGTGSGSYGNSLAGLGAAPEPFWSLGAVGSASWEIDVFGRLRRGREAARAEYLASEEARRGVWLTVLGDVAQGYFQLLALDLQRAIGERTVKARADVLDFFRVRAEGGVGTDLDVARGEADMFGAEETLAEVRQEMSLAEHSISLLLGRPPGTIARPRIGDALPTPPEVPVGLPAALLERRPDVREAEANMMAANARVGIATANLFPTFSLTASGGIASTNLSLAASRGTQTSGVYSVGGDVNWLAPILQGDALRDQLQASKKEWLAVRTLYVKTVTAAFKDVADALVELAQLRERRVEAKKQVASLARAVDVSRTQFEGGTANYLDVITAQELLFPNELSLAQVEGQLLASYVHLYRALGGGWSLAERAEGP
jgi:multidrug efflux system outer membrane protein